MNRLFLLLVLAGAVAALTAAGRHEADAADQAVRSVSAQELQLRNDMRRLWEDHVTWTRLAIISLTTDAADTKPTVARLLRNQTDIGNAIKPFYGAAAGKALTGLLRDHILIAANVVAAARAGDAREVAAAQARWTANADEIAVFLNRANPRFWKVAHMKAMLRDHLRLTTREAVARIRGDWRADIAAYDEIHRQALHMADDLAAGIVGRFPGRFR